MKKVFALLCGMVFLLCGCASVLPDEVKTVEVFKESTVRGALLSKEPTAQEQALIQKVTNPSSLGIILPNIDPAKIAPEDSPLLSELPQFEEYRTSLLEHNKTEEEIQRMTYAEYNAWYRTWLLSEEQINELKERTPSLEKKDLSGWTNGDYEDYQIEMSQKNLLADFSSAQQEELKKRGIEIVDLFVLIKAYHQPESILSRSDEERLCGQFGYGFRRGNGRCHPSQINKKAFTEFSGERFFI